MDSGSITAVTHVNVLGLHTQFTIHGLLNSLSRQKNEVTQDFLVNRLLSFIS